MVDASIAVHGERMALAALHVAWNLWLALVAVGLSFALAALLRVDAKWHARWVVAIVLVASAWLLMLPNTCYLFTEVRHLFDAIGEQHLWARAHASSSARWMLALRSIVLIVYVATGALTFGLGVRVVREAIEARGWSLSLALPAFFFVVALGVYLGLVLRLNSWDALLHPLRVVHDAIDVVRAPRRLRVLVLGAGVLWIVYALVDVWIDGARARLRRLAW
jgi:uncharacterized membrane protein